MVAMVNGVSMVATVASMGNVVSIVATVASMGNVVSIVATVASMGNVSVVATAASMGNVSIVATVTNAPRRNAAGRASERERQRWLNNSPAPSVAGEPFFWRQHLPRMVDRQDRMAGLQNSVDASTPNAERLSDLGSDEALGFHLAHPGRVY